MFTELLLLFAGGDRRVLAGHRVLQGRLGDGDFLLPPFPFVHLVFCWAASLSVICCVRIFLHNTFFRQKHPRCPQAWLTKSPVATVTLSPPPLLLSEQTSQDLAAQMEGRKCLCKPGRCHRGCIWSLMRFPYSDDFFSVIKWNLTLIMAGTYCIIWLSGAKCIFTGVFDYEMLAASVVLP